MEGYDCGTKSKTSNYSFQERAFSDFEQNKVGVLKNSTEHAERLFNTLRQFPRT